MHKRYSDHNFLDQHLACLCRWKKMTALSCVWSVFFCLFLFHHSKGKKKPRICLSIKRWYRVKLSHVILSMILSQFRKLFFFSEQYVGIYVTNTKISVGTSYISVNCDLYGKSIFRDKYSKIEFHLQCRLNKTNDWQTIVLLNDSGPFITNISKDIETHLERNETCDYYGYRYGKGCRIYANISIHLESCKGYLDPSFRCQIFDIERRIAVDGSGEVQVEIASK